MNLPILADALSAFATAFLQNERMLKARFSPTAGIPDNTLLPWKLTGHEAINEGYHYELTCLCASAHLELKDLIGQPVEVSILTDSGDYRPITGWVRRVVQDQSDGGMGRYILVIEDLISFLKLRINNRVFQSISAKDAFLTIVREHLRDNPILAASLDIDDRTTRDYPIQSWITQYNESDAAFGLRRLFEDGINFYFEHDASSEHPSVRLVLFDDNTQLNDSPADTVRFHRADGTEETDSITAWRAERTLAPSQLSAASYDYKTVAVSRPEESSRLDQGEAGNGLASTLEDYRHDSSHYGNDFKDYERYADLRMQSYDYAAKGFNGEGTFRNVPVGSRFGLSQHPEIDAHDELDRLFILTQLHIDAVNNLPGELGDKIAQTSGEQKVFQNSFNASRDRVRIVPEYRHTTHAKPSAPHLLSATVVGPDGEEIHTDDLGRICVNLHYPRPQDHPQGGASRNENDSVWLRVMQLWSGGEYGTLFVPRIGDEVLVAFIGGDIDRPIVLGNAYNNAQRPASFSHSSKLPGNKTLSGIKSKMYKGAGANELLLDDSTNQLRARLATDHGKTELNQGYLVHPRHDGEATPRGEGFELRSDLSGALRAALGILISSDGRSRANGNQLDRQEFQGQIELTLNILKHLSELSNTHHAEATDFEPQEQLLDHIKNWEAGSNTDKNGDKSKGGKPIVAISGQAGIAISTPQNAALSAGTNLDMVSVQDTSISTGRSFLARASERISLFALKLGLKIVAAMGKIEIRADNDNVEITASKKIILTALEEIVLQAPKYTLITQGAGMDVGNGQITTKTTGVHTAHAGQHTVTGPAAPNFTPPNLPQSELKTDEKFVTSGRGGQARQALPYQLAEAGKRSLLASGKTAADGGTDITQDTLIKNLNLKLKDD